MLTAIEDEALCALRERAILAIGMAAAILRSEIVVLDADHVGTVTEGLGPAIASPKADRAALGAIVAIPEGGIRRKRGPVGQIKPLRDWDCIIPEPLAITLCILPNTHSVPVS